MSIIVPSSHHTGIGAWVNSKMYTSILYNIINCHPRISHKHRIHGKLLPDIILLTQGYYQWGTRLNTGGCSEGLALGVL